MKIKNKTLAILGIGIWVLGILTSASDSQGNYIMPIILIVISGISDFIFTIMAIIRLWKNSKYLSILFIISTIILCLLTLAKEVFSPQYGSPIIILFNITKVADFIIFILVIKSLFENGQTIKKDIIFNDALDLIKKSGTVSYPKIMRHFKVGYARAIRLLNELEKAGILEPVKNDLETRKVLIKHENDDSVWKNPCNR